MNPQRRHTGHSSSRTAAGAAVLVRGIAAACLVTAAITALAAVSIFKPFAFQHAPAPQPQPTFIERAALRAEELTQARDARDDPAQRRLLPQWIWLAEATHDGQPVIFERDIAVESRLRLMKITLTCDNAARVFLNDAFLFETTEWTQPVAFEVPQTSLPPRATTATLRVEARNEGGPAGLLAVIEIDYEAVDRQRIVSDGAWRASSSESGTASSAAAATPAKVIARYGGEPWGELPHFGPVDIDRGFEAPPGFRVELVCKVPRELGSWVSLCIDSRGRLIASDQQDGLFRITPAAAPGETALIEAIDSPLGAAQGLCVVDDVLYCVVNGGRAEGSGLYTLRDTDGDDRYDAHALLRRFEGAGEHGPHAVVEGPDGLLYIVGGNHTRLPQPETSVVPRIWDEDHLLPRLWDAGGHAVGILAPGGWICRTDSRGETFELFAIGFRNPYDIAFNDAGDLFTYDADMEWDMGAPWYRPTRICHVTSGADFGWRSGTAKWPEHYPESLPPTLDMGPGSPTGVCFGRGAAFPQKYQRSLFACDWTFGTIYAIHLEPRGGTYRAVREVFLTGQPLPVADVSVNPVDGALYFVVGGRGVPSAIYRVVHEQAEVHVPRADPADASAVTADGALRRRLEAMHGRELDERELDFVWEHLAHDDRFVRSAARVALELQPRSQSIILDRLAQNRSPRDPQRTLAALLALIRTAEGSSRVRDEALDRLERMDFDALPRDLKLAWLRCEALAFIRCGEPDAAACRRIRAPLEAIYPTDDDAINRELCDLLVYLDSPTVVSRTIALMEETERDDDEAAGFEIDPQLLARNDTYGSVITKMAMNPPQQQQVHFALSLRHAAAGWTPQLRERYFRWFETARQSAGGLSFSGFVEQIRSDALERLPEPERARYAAIRDEYQSGEFAMLPQPKGPGRQWSIDEVVALADGGLRERDFDNGRLMYQAARCDQCHRFAGTGRMGGPDLTAVATRYTLRDLAEAMVEPSRTISDQYQHSELVLDDDSIVLGRVVDERADSITIMPSLLVPEATVEIEKSRIASRRASLVSPMPPQLLDRLNEEEVRDLLAYLLAEGDRRDGRFVQTKGVASQ